MRQIFPIAIMSMFVLVGCGKGIDLKRDVVFVNSKPVILWYEPLSSEQQVEAFFNSTGFLADCFLIQAESEVKAKELVNQQLPGDGFHVGWSFKPDDAIVLAKVLGQENSGFDATIPSGKGFAAVLYPVSAMPPDYAGTYKGYFWISNQ